MLLLQIVWTATCGTLTPMGDSARYTAPASGPCRVIAAAGASKDTALVTVALAEVVTGVPFGPSQWFGSTSTTAPFTLAVGESATSPTALVNAINTARGRGVKLIVNLPCGGHQGDTGGDCLTLVNGWQTFDMAKFTAEMAAYNTTTTKQAVAAAVSDGTLLGINIMDEPMVSSATGNSWGPPGYMTKARVDSMCATSKKIFPTAVVGPQHQWGTFDKGHNYAVCDMFMAQWLNRFGSITAWADTNLQGAAKQGTGVIFTFNIVNGGTQDKDGTYDCATQGGVKGTYAPNCSMTAAQITAAVQALGGKGCGGLGIWRWDDQRMAAQAQAYRDAAAMLAARTIPKCAVR